MLSNSYNKIKNSTSKNYWPNHKDKKFAYSFKFRRYSLNNNKIHNIKLIPNLKTISSVIKNILSIKDKKNNFLLIIIK